MTHKKALIVLSVFALLLTACDQFMAAPDGNESAVDTEQMMIEDDDSSNDDDDMVGGDGTSIDDGEGALESETEADVAYAPYMPAVLADGQMKVLFFHAAWCPICRQADQTITAWFDADRAMVSVYKVDYDSETELKSRYGVTYQHTYVLVDGEGNALKTLLAPTDSELQMLMGA